MSQHRAKSTTAETKSRSSASQIGISSITTGSTEMPSTSVESPASIPLAAHSEKSDKREQSAKLQEMGRIVPFDDGRQNPPEGYILASLDDKLFWIDPKAIRVHDAPKLHELTKAQKNRITAYYNILSKYLRSSLEEVILDMEKELVPEREIRLWERMARIYRLENQKRPNAQETERIFLWAVILHSSHTGRLEHVLSAVPSAVFLPDVDRVVRTMAEHGIAYAMQMKLRFDLRLIRHYAEKIEPLLTENVPFFTSELKRQINDLSDVERADFEVLTIDPTQLLGNTFIHTLRTFAFVSAYVLFESALMQLCKLIGQLPGNPPFNSDKKGDGLREGKEYLKHAGFQFPAHLNQWRKLQSYKTIRNFILHENSILDDSANAIAVREFLLKEGIGIINQERRINLNQKAIHDIGKVIDDFGIALRRTLERA